MRRRTQFGMIDRRRGRSKVGWYVIGVLLALVLAGGLKRYSFAEPRDVSWLRDTPIAHRGLHTLDLEENSLGAFRNAVVQGYPIELDVRLTKDGSVVVVHDDDLERVFGVEGKVSAMTLSEIQAVKFPHSGEALPTLAEVLSLVDGRTPILIEVKNFGFAGKLEAEALKVLEGYRGDYAFQSFGPLSVRWTRKNAPSVASGLLLQDFAFTKNRFTRNLKDNLFALVCKPNFVAYAYESVSPEITEGYRNGDVLFLGWTVNEDVVENKSYTDMVDNVIFEYK